VRLSVVEIAAAMLLAVCKSPAQSTQVGSTPAPEAGAKPLMLEKSEGERRLWRPEPGEVDPGGFIIKASPKNNGSQHLVSFTGAMARETQYQRTNTWGRMKSC
jgi:hypothetical protein